MQKLQNTVAEDKAAEQLQKMKQEMGLAPAEQPAQQSVRNIEV